jgi:hypothetical protein
MGRTMNADQYWSAALIEGVSVGVSYSWEEKRKDRRGAKGTEKRIKV